MTGRFIDPEVGIHRDIAFSEYVAWNAANASFLKTAGRSWAHAQAKREKFTQPTLDMRLGSFTHSVILEPSRLLEEYVVMPDFEAEIEAEFPGKWSKIKATDEYKNRLEKWSDENGHKEQIPPHWPRLVREIERNIHEGKNASRYMARPAEAELSIVWIDEDTGMKCKARVDWWQERESRIVDLKTTKDASRFEWDMRDYQYSLQGAFYVDGMMHVTGGRIHEFCIVAVEKEKPFGVRAAPVSEQSLEAGREQYKKLLVELAECQRTNVWPGYEDPREWVEPFKKRTEEKPVSLTIGGSQVTV